MGSSTYRKVPGTCAVLGSLILAGSQAQAQPQKRLGPDLLQTLGVGSRSIAMGNAFTAIADDASAGFWNPGRLGFLSNKREVMFELRPVINTDYHTTFGPTGSLLEDQRGFHPGKPQLGFASFVYPLNRTSVSPERATAEKAKAAAAEASEQAKKLQGDARLEANKKVLALLDAANAAVKAADDADKGKSYLGETVSISYTLGGYFSNERLLLNPKTNNFFNETTVRNSFLTFAYGRQLSTRLGVGVGLFFVNQDFTTRSNSNFVAGNNPRQSGDFQTDRGNAFGVNLGVAADQGRHWSLGATYRTGVRLHGLRSNVGAAFNTEIPGRFTIGAAYKGASSSVKGSYIVSTEFQVFEAASRDRDQNGNLRLPDARRAVGNFHLGVEYLPDILNRPNFNYLMPLRFGFHTNANAATSYTDYDNVLSFGFAYQRTSSNDQTIGGRSRGYLYTIEPTVEMLTSNGAFQFTISGRLQF